MAGKRRLIGSIAFETSAGAVFGDKRIRLLEAIATHGSLNRAAKTVPLSYKAAWDALDAINNLAPQPLVVRSTGGRDGGGTQLTDEGRRMVALYRALESSQQDVLDRVDSSEARAAADAGMPLRSVLRRLAMKTSARNQFVGHVHAIRVARGSAAVELALEGGERLVAAVTPESVETLGLAAGVQVHALVKAPSVTVTSRAPRARAGMNVYEGEIASLQRAAERTRMTLVTPGGRTIASSMPSAAATRSAMRLHGRAWANFAADSVILVTFE